MVALLLCYLTKYFCDRIQGKSAHLGPYSVDKQDGFYAYKIYDFFAGLSVLISVFALYFERD